MALLTWIVVGIALGLIARWVTRRRVGIFWALVAGLIGALVGGLIGRLAGYGGIIGDFSIWSLLIAVACSVVALIVLAMIFPRRRR